MRRIKDNFGAINEMRNSLNKIKNLTLESFIMPEEEETYGAEEGVTQETPQEEDEVAKQDIQGLSNIEKELIEIRKIALSVINRLADQTNSESYDTMKRIWSLVDKAIESKNNEDKFSGAQN